MFGSCRYPYSARTVCFFIMILIVQANGFSSSDNSSLNCTDIEWGDVNTSNNTELSEIFQICLDEYSAYEDCPDPSVCDGGEPNSKNLLLAFGLTILAGLATTIGALIPFIPCIQRSDTKYLGAALGLAAGVMLYVSFTEIFDESKFHFCCVTRKHYNLLAASSFFVGIIVTVLLDALVKLLEKLDCGCSSSCSTKCMCVSRTSNTRQRNSSNQSNLENGPVTRGSDHNSVQLNAISNLPTNRNVFHCDQGSLLEPNNSEFTVERNSIPSNNNSPTLHSHTDYSIPDNDRQAPTIDRASISAASNTISTTTNNLGDASIQDLLSNTSIHRLHAVISESVSIHVDGASHISVSLMNENDDGFSLRTQSIPNGDVQSRISAPSLQRRTSYEEMVEEQEQSGVEGIEQFREITNIVNPDIQKLRHMGVLTGLAIAIHNFPEGLATFIATLSDPSLGIALAIAISIHNIPEGICVAMPVYYATGSRVKAFFWAFLSGVSEPVGALLGWLIFQYLFGPLAYGIAFGIIAGMMVYIVLKELLPTAHKFDKTNGIIVAIFLVIGMAVMALSLVLFQY